MKIPKKTNYTETLKIVKKTLAKRTFKDKGEKRKTKNKSSISKVALNSTKIDLSTRGGFKKKISPNREISPAGVYSGPSSARNNKATKIVYPTGNMSFGVVQPGRLQPTQQLGKGKRSKKNSSSSSCKKRSPQLRKFKNLK